MRWLVCDVSIQFAFLVNHTVFLAYLARHIHHCHHVIFLHVVAVLVTPLLWFNMVFKMRAI